MRIVITGGAGFVGSNLSIYLKIQHPDYTIVSFDNLKRRGSELNLVRLKQNEVDFIHGDIRNPEDIEQIGPCDLIVDASADPSVLSGIDSTVYPLINSNLMGTVNILEFASKHSAKLIFLSTSRVYPIRPIESANWVETETRFIWSDNQTLKGLSSKGISEIFTLEGSRSFYGATKLASEILITEYAAHKGIEYIINRCGVLSGPWQMGKIDQGVVVLWLARHFFKGKLAYIGYDGTGKQTRDVLHIQDFVELIDLQIHDYNLFLNQTLNVGGGLEMSFSLLELTKLCAEITGNQIPIDHIKANRPADLRIYIGDQSKIHSISTWRAARGLPQLLDDTLKWIKEHEDNLRTILS
jgi:CDP-paratose 2-epimerase